mmetsp:Transcript_589/g.928  ORF Transcript_589/g.928 Transcript_589/m.928 type:complete len:212 (+) Transcript_589:5657-6292(+)
MGGKKSKPEEPKEPKDERWELSRGFGPNIAKFSAKLEEKGNLPIDEALPRPIHSSTYWRTLPQYQSLALHFGAFWFIYRKLPFTNPVVRVLIMLAGIDYVRFRKDWHSLLTHEDIKEVRTFDRIYQALYRRTLLRVPDFVEESEDWYDMNKPAYRLPVNQEQSLDSWMRYFIINRKKYGLRPTQWHGEWEQENCLVMDLHAPHADHWLDIH